MSGKTALVNGAVYLGRGERIDKGFVAIDGPYICQVGAMTCFTREAGYATVDLKGGLVVPGFVDSHLHLVDYATSLAEPDLAQSKTADEGLAVVRDRVKLLPREGWLFGRGWDKQRWGLTAFPTRQMLDIAAPENPAAITSRDGHLVWLNTLGLRRLGLWERLPEVVGGEIETDCEGVPTGILKENAANLVWDRVDRQDRSTTMRALRTANDRILRLGITCVHTIESPKVYDYLSEALAAGLVSVGLVRLREAYCIGDVDRLPPSPEIDCIKIYADGTLGSQTARMMEPYSGQAGNLGIEYTCAEELRRMAFAAASRGFGVAVHAIGDRAVGEVLDVYQEMRRQERTSRTLLRIEHVQVVRPDDVPRFARLGVVASMQPVHLVSDMDVATRYWGERCVYAYAWRSVLETGATLVFGSDAPNESLDPRPGLHAAVTRRVPGDRTRPAWHPEQCLTLAEALDCYTSHNRIAPGLRSDLAVLQSNVLASDDPDAILDTPVVATVVGGAVHLHA